MQFTRQQIIFLIVAGILVVVFLLLVFVGGKQSVEKVNLTVWGIDDELVWDYAVRRYQRAHPGAHIKYTEFKPEMYEEELINALAAGRGPDIFMINNRWTVKHADKIAPMPAGKMSAADFSGLFPQVVEHDFLAGSSTVYGLPLSVDTLALFYNRDIFDRKSVALPPKTWEEFLAVVPKLRTIDKSGSLTLAAAAIGGSSKNIGNAPDILELLMLQTGALSAEDYPSETVRGEEGRNALEFYTRFASATSSAYTWNDSFPTAFEAFAKGKVAMVFGYAGDISEVKDQNPFLNFAVAPTPQADLEKTVNGADYWGLTVSPKTANLNMVIVLKS